MGSVVQLVKSMGLMLSNIQRTPVIQLIFHASRSRWIYFYVSGSYSSRFCGSGSSITTFIQGTNQITIATLKVALVQPRGGQSCGLGFGDAAARQRTLKRIPIEDKMGAAMP